MRTTENPLDFMPTFSVGGCTRACAFTVYNRLMPTIFIVHVCGNAIHIGTQCLYVKTKLWM